MRNAIELMFPEKFTVQTPEATYDRRGYIWDKWSDRSCKSFCGQDPKNLRQFQTWWGPAASGKSTRGAIFGLMMWLASPMDTTVLVLSTTRDALEHRIWREVVKFYKMRENEFPGALVPSKTAIYFDKKGDTLSGIHGVAVQKGTIQDSLGNLIGRHNTNMIIILDEMQSMREAVLEAWDNWSVAPNALFLGMGNPMSKLDLLGSVSMPVGGWSKLTTEKEEWRTKRGVTLFFDGLKSPGVDDPVKHPYLLCQHHIDAMMEDPGPDHPRFWTMRRGFLPPDGLIWSVLTEQMIGQYHVQDDVIWESAPVRVCGCDPAYSSGGDKCILQPALVGRMANGAIGIAFSEPITVNLVAEVGKSMLDTLTSDIAKHLISLNCPITNFGMDTTGNQWILADAIEDKMNQTGIRRVSFTGGASKDPISLQDPRPASELYSNKVTELWGRFGTYVKNDMIRGLPQETAKQFCIRIIDFDKGNKRRVTIESKKLLKERLGFSPDEADAAVVLVDVVRTVLGILPEKKTSVGGLTAEKGSVEYLAKQSEKLYEDDGFDSDEDGSEEFAYDFDEEDFDV
jgi:hypothetical protein